MKILVAEDTPEMLNFITTLLLQQNYKVISAKDGEKAIAKYDEAVLTNEKFDLLLLDAAMPKKSGFEVAEYVRSKNDKCVSIIFVTAFDDPISHAHALHINAGLLYKPFGVSKLLELVGEVDTKRKACHV